MKNKIEASALFYTLFLSTILAIVSTALISLNFYNTSFFQQNVLEERLMRNVQSALTICLTNDSIQEGNLDLYSDSQDSVNIQQLDWGLFKVANFCAFHNTVFGQREYCKTGLLGQNKESVFQPALYLQDNRKALAVGGETRIKGKAYLPKPGVVAATINHQNYSGDQLIYGPQLRSSPHLPEIDSILLERQLQVFELSNGQSMDIYPDSLVQSFQDSTIWITGNRIYLKDKFYKGKIVIVATQSIHVTGTSVLEDVLLYAPSITLDSGFKGMIQCFAKEQILLKEDVHLKFPSVVALLKKQSYDASFIKLEPNVRIDGLILSKKLGRVRVNPEIFVRDKCKIRGLIYSDGALSAKGIVLGTIITKSFSFRSEGRAYHNHVFDLVIDPDNRPKAFAFPLLVKSNYPKTVVKWLK